MKCEVLRQFRIATDSLGIQSKELNQGDVYDVPDAMVPSLEAEGYIKPVDEKPAKPEKPKKPKASDLEQSAE